ncbi:MAG: AAA family ATPase [bacterium]|nr:AAA family ATPase [bacterium]
MAEFLPQLSIVWRPVEFESVGGMDTLHAEYLRVIAEGGHAWWTQRLSLSYVRLLDRVLTAGKPVYLYPLDDPRAAGPRIFRLRARVDAVLYNPDGSFRRQPDDNIPFRRTQADAIYSACWIRLTSMEEIPPAEMPDPNGVVVLPYGDNLLEAVRGRFSKGFIVPTGEYETFRRTTLASSLDVIDELGRARPVGAAPSAEKKTASLAESVFDQSDEELTFRLSADRVPRMAGAGDGGTVDLRLDTGDHSLVIDAPDLRLGEGAATESEGEMSLHLGDRGKRVVRHEARETFHMDHPIVRKKDTATEEKQLIDLGIDWEMLSRMRSRMEEIESVTGPPLVTENEAPPEPEPAFVPPEEPPVPEPEEPFAVEPARAQIPPVDAVRSLDEVMAEMVWETPATDAVAPPVSRKDQPAPALTSKELSGFEVEPTPFPDLPPLAPSIQRWEAPEESLTGLNLLAGELEADEPALADAKKLLIPTVDALLRSVEARDARRTRPRDGEDHPLALPRDVAASIRRIRDQLVIDNEQIAHVITNLLLGKHVIISGPTGCGKTTLARMLPALVWNIYPELVQSLSSWGPEDLLGLLYPLPDGGVAVSGILTRTVLKNFASTDDGYARTAYRAPNGAQYNGVWLVLDELDNCDWTSLLSDFLATSDAPAMKISVSGSPGEYLDIPLPMDFRLIATFNSQDGLKGVEQLSQSTRRRLAFVELRSPTDEEAEREIVRRKVQNLVYEQLGLAVKETDLSGQIEDSLFRLVRLVRAYHDIGTAPLVTILADIQVEAQMGLDAWKTLDEAVATNLVPLFSQIPAAHLRIIGNLAANAPERILAYFSLNLPKRYTDEAFCEQLYNFCVFLYRTARYRSDPTVDELKEIVDMVGSGIPRGKVGYLVSSLEPRPDNLASSLLPAIKLGTTLFETIRSLTRLVNRGE